MLVSYPGSIIILLDRQLGHWVGRGENRFLEPSPFSCWVGLLDLGAEQGLHRQKSFHSNNLHNVFQPGAE